MTTLNRVDITRWALGVAALIVALLHLPAFGDWPPLGWLVVGVVTVLTAVIQALGINTGPLGKVSFLPTAALMAYFVLGLEPAMIASSVGLLCWSAMHMLRRRADWAHRLRPLWGTAGAGWLALAQNVLGLLAGDFAYRILGTAPPLYTVTDLRNTLPIIAAVTFYLLAHNLLLVLDAALRGVSPRTMRERYNVMIPAMHILPVGLAPFAAIASASMGQPAFFIFAGILATLAVVIKRLVKTQNSLQRQIEQFARLASISQTLRSNLDIDTLLLNAYLQIAALLNLKNVLIVLRENSREASWRVRFASLNGHRLNNPDNYPIDDFTRWVLHEQKPLYADPVTETAARLGLAAPEARAWLGLPLLAARRTIGCIVVWLDEDQQPGRQLSESDRDLLGAIAVQTEMALQNALLYQEAQQHAAQLARVNEISAMLNSSLNPEEVLKMVVSSAIEVAGCDRAAIYLRQGADGLVLTEAQGFPADLTGKAQAELLPLTPEQRCAVLDNGETVLVSDLEQEQDNLGTGALRLAGEGGFSAFACLPLTTPNGRIGLLTVFYDQPHTFAESELELLETFANQAALAVTNAQDYQQIDAQLTRRSSQIARVADLGEWLNATLDLGTICRLVLDAALEGCGVPAGLLVLVGANEPGQSETELQMAAWRGFDPGSTHRAPHHVAEELMRSGLLSEGRPHALTISVREDNGLRRSQLTAPIAIDNQLLGTLLLESPDPNAFNDDDLNFVRQLTMHAAATIRNGRLYRHTQRMRDTLRATLDASSDGLLMIDSQGRTVMANARMEDFWDFARAGLPKTTGEGSPGQLRELSEGLGYAEDELKRLLEEGRRSHVLPARKDMVVTQPRAGQRQRYVERAIRPVYGDEEQFVGLLLVFRDITEQQELEQARKDLTDMVVHELRSPLQAVMGSMRLISQVAPADSAIIHQATEVSQRGQEAAQPDQQPARPLPAGTGRVCA